LSAEEEESKVIAQANATIDGKGKFQDTKVKARLMVTFLLLNLKEWILWTLLLTRLLPSLLPLISIPGT